MAEVSTPPADRTTALGERATPRSTHTQAAPGVMEAKPSPAAAGAKRPPLTTAKLDPRPLRERFKSGKE